MPLADKDSFTARGEQGVLTYAREPKTSRATPNWLGYLAVAVCATVFILIVLPAISSGPSRAMARRARCVSQLKALGLAVREYQGETRELPPDLQTAVRFHEQKLGAHPGSPGSMLMCRGSSGGAACDYAYFVFAPGPARDWALAHADACVIACDDPAHHEGQGLMLFLSGRTASWASAEFWAKLMEFEQSYKAEVGVALDKVDPR